MINIDNMDSKSVVRPDFRRDVSSDDADYFVNIPRRRWFCKSLEIDPTDVNFQKRGFARGCPAVQERLETAASTFVQGYNTALHFRGDTHDLTAFPTCPPAMRGFFVEGAAMALAITDTAPFSALAGRRLSRFLAQCATDHPYLSAVGAGWALNKIPWRRRAILQSLEPTLALLAFDGWGFFRSFFAPNEILWGPPKQVFKYGGERAVRSWDRGAGRALWFTSAGSPERVVKTVYACDPARQRDIWAGLGLAVTYAGGLARAEAHMLCQAAGSDAAWLCQGSAFALEAHKRAGTGSGDVDVTFTALTGRSTADGLAIVRNSRPDPIPEEPLGDAYRRHDAWRAEIAAQLTGERAPTHDVET